VNPINRPKRGKSLARAMIHVVQPDHSNLAICSDKGGKVTLTLGASAARVTTCGNWQVRHSHAKCIGKNRTTHTLFPLITFRIRLQNHSRANQHRNDINYEDVRERKILKCTIVHLELFLKEVSFMYCVDENYKKSLNQKI